MPNHTSKVERDPVLANMASPADDSRRTITDDIHTPTSATIDIQPYTQHKEPVMTDSEVTDASGAARCSTKADLSTSFTNSSAGIILDTPGNLHSLSQTGLSTSSATSSAKHGTSDAAEAKRNEVTHDYGNVASPVNTQIIKRTASKKPVPDGPGGFTPSANPDAEAAGNAIQSTKPVPTIYPPRRPNIFRARQKHIRFPFPGLSAVAPRTVGTTPQELEAADGFAVADLEEFQAEIRERMKKKSERFMSMVHQSAPVWQRRVEDLGEVFEIEG